MKRAISTICTLILVAAMALAQQQEGFKTHTVRWYEDLESISAQYGVPADVISKINKLKNGKVSNRQKILIPLDEKYWNVEIAENGQPAQTAQALENIDSSAFFPSGRRHHNHDNFRLGLVLALDGVSESQRNNALDFYAGVLMGIREMGLQGMDISLDVRKMPQYDMEGLDEIEENDMVIAPFRYNEVETVLRECRKKTIVVSALDHKVASLASTRSMLFQAPSSSAYQFDSAIEAQPGDNFIVIGSESDPETLEEVREMLYRKGIYRYTVCMSQAQGDISGWDGAYQENACNKVILAIAAEAPLNNAIRNMGIMESKGNVISYAPGKAASYASIPVENLHWAHLRVMSPYYADYSDSATLDFIHTYRALFKCEPSQYAFQGHDLAIFLAKSYKKLGDEWEEAIVDEPQMDLLQSSFKLIRHETGGWQNIAVRQLEYKRDYSIELLRTNP